MGGLRRNEPILPEESPDGDAHVLTVIGGVFPALVPESISGAVALDYTEGLARHRRVAVCAHCNRAVVLSNQQAGRARKGLPVYHDECARAGTDSTTTAVTAPTPAAVTGHAPLRFIHGPSLRVTRTQLGSTKVAAQCPEWPNLSVKVAPAGGSRPVTDSTQHS